jgi:hypothetical protein
VLGWHFALLKQGCERMKKWLAGGSKHIDKAKLAAKAKAKADLANLLEVGDENGYVDYLKRLKPNMTPAELQNFIALFRAERQRQASGRRTEP